MIMGGEVYLGEPTYTQAWTIGRQLGLQIAAHILSPFGMRPILDDLAAGTGGTGNNIGLGSDNLFIHMTGMSDFGWQKVKDKGAQVSIAFPIEMNMRHGIPPILKMQQLGIEPSLSSDVETNMTACFFTQMRSAMTMQRMVVNQMILEQGTSQSAESVAAAGAGHAAAAQRARRAALRHHQRREAPAARQQDRLAQARQGGRHHHPRRAPTSTSSPVNHVPGAVVQMMDRSNVETVIVAGKVRKWKGRLLDVDLQPAAPASSRTRATSSTRRRAFRRTCSADGRRIACDGGAASAAPLRTECAYSAGPAGLPCAASVSATM